MPTIVIPDVEVTLKAMTCGVCATHFAIDETKYNRCKRNGDSWFCPNGHERVFAKSDAQIAKETLESERAEFKRKERELTDKMLDEMNKRRESDRKLKRLHKGVCSCCNRSFVNLARHMKTKHPELVTK